MANNLVESIMNYLKSDEIIRVHVKSCQYASRNSACVLVPHSNAIKYNFTEKVAREPK
jgi:hypothetical protein